MNEVDVNETTINQHGQITPLPELTEKSCNLRKKHLRNNVNIDETVIINIAGFSLLFFNVAEI